MGFLTRLDLTSLEPGGLPIDGAGDPAVIPGLPRTSLAQSAGLTLYRLADNPWEEGYQLFLSEEVSTVADLRAAKAYARTAKEDGRCVRCSGAALGVGSDAREFLSGFTVAVTLPQELRQYLSNVYGGSNSGRPSWTSPASPGT